ncbi:transcription initiation factor TFIID component TAF4 family-domain-containing protein, partial [Blakeslea trispora]
MNSDILTEIMTRFTSAHQLKLNPDTVALIALATEKRIHQLLIHMTSASKHRVNSQTFTQPPANPDGHHPFKIVDIQDIKKQLLAIERVEREEERKRKEMLLENERKALLGEDGADGDDDRPMKKKKKKEMGPGVTARYMSDDVRNKTTNETALMIAGGVMKSWMLTGMNTSTPKEKPSRPFQAPENTPSSLSPPPPQTPQTSSAPTPPPSINPPLHQHDQPTDDQPRGRGRPRRRKSGSGPELMSKKAKPPNAIHPTGTTPTTPTHSTIATHRPQPESGLFLPPSTIGRPHRLGEQGTRKVTVRDALYVLEDESEHKPTRAARRTLLKAYTSYL